MKSMLAHVSSEAVFLVRVHTIAIVFFIAIQAYKEPDTVFGQIPDVFFSKACHW